MCGASTGWCGHHVSSWHHSCAFCNAVFSPSPGKVWKVSQIHSHGWRGGDSGEGGGEGEGGGGEGNGNGGGEGGGFGCNVSGGGGDVGGAPGVAVQVSTSLSTPGATSTLVRSQLRPGQHGSVPEQSCPTATHAVPGGRDGIAPTGGGGLGGLGGGRGGLGGLGERRCTTAGGDGGGDGCGGGDGLRNRAVEPLNKRPPCVRFSSCCGMSVIASQTPSTSARNSSSRRHPRLEHPHQFRAYHVLDARFRCSSSSSGTTATTGTSLASVGTGWCRCERSPRSDSNVSCMPCFSISSPARNSLNEKARVGPFAQNAERTRSCGRAVVRSCTSMQVLALAASVVVLLVVSVVSTRVLMRVLLPSREEVLRLQNERIERMLREESDAPYEMEEV